MINCPELSNKTIPKKVIRATELSILFIDREIDLIAADETKMEILFAERKWSSLSEKEARAALNSLAEKSAFVGWKRKKEYFGIIAKKVSGK